MASKLIVLLLSALLLVQLSVGIPMPESDTKKECNSDDSSSDTTSEEDIAKTAAGLLILAEIEELSDEVVKGGKALIEDVVADINAIENKSASLQSQIKELTTVLDVLENGHRTIKTIKYTPLTSLALPMGINDIMESVSDSPENEIIKDSFKKHGVEKYMSDTEKKFMDFTVDFYEVADKYWDELCPEEKAQQKEFGEWLEFSKSIKNPLQKIASFVEGLRPGKRPETEKKTDEI